MTGLPSSVITMSDYMRVSHSGTSKLKIPEILKIFWPASEPCREATSMYSDTVFPVRILRILTYQPCKYEGMCMHSVDTLICRSWWKYRWIMEIARQKCPILKGFIKRLDLQTTYRYRAETFRVYSYMIGLHSSVITMSWLYAGQSQRDVKVENSSHFKNILTCMGAL